MTLLFASLLLSAAPLSLDQAVAEGIERNETYGIAKARQTQAEADLRGAWSELLPSADLSARYTRRRNNAEINGNPIRANDALNGSVVARTTLFEAAEIPSIQAAQEDLEATETQTDATVRAFAFDVATAFLEVVVFERTRAAAEQRLNLADTTLSEVEQRAAAGLTSTNDVSRSKLELASARLVLTEARNDVVQSRLQLGFLLGRAVDEPLVDPILLGSADAEDIRPLVEDAMNLRPDVLVLRTRVDAAARRALEPWLRLIPSIEGEASFTLTNETGFQGREFDYALSLIAAWPIYDGGVRYADAKRTRARLEELRLQLQQLTRTVEVGIRSRLAERSRAQAAVTQAEARVEVAEVNAAEVGERFRAGLATALEQADANVQLFEARARLESSRFELSQAELGVLEARGGVPPGYALPSDGAGGEG